MYTSTTKIGTLITKAFLLCAIRTNFFEGGIIIAYLRNKRNVTSNASRTQVY